MKIGNVEIKGKVVLAPMAGISNSAFRRIAKEMGCGLVVAEMVSDKAIYYGNQKTINMLYMTEEEHPISQQIFGSDKESFVVAAKYIYEKMKPDIIDINMGCPVPKVALRAQAGSALLKDIPKIKDIIKSIKDVVPCPITVKIRSGWDEQNINAVEVAKACEEAGASAITIHARTRNQGYSGKADWNIIKQIKENINIPVIGNGDVIDIYTAKKMLEETNCDLIMIGRGLLGNPWLIKEINYYIEQGIILLPPTNNEKILMILKHIKYLKEFKADKEVALEMRTIISYYLKGMPKAKEIKQQIMLTKNTKDLENLLINYQKDLEFQNNE